MVIGRVAECDIVLADTAASRHHARLEVNAGRATVVDQGSQNGTLVNNQRVVRQELADGDILTIGTAIIVFHGALSPEPSRLLVSLAELRRQLGRELERVIHRGSSLAIACLRVAADDRARIEREVMSRLRPLDLAAWDGEQLVLLLADGEPDESERVVGELAAALAAIRAGLATAPRDGCSASALLDGARAAAALAAPGALVLAGATSRTLALGDRVAAIADAAMSRLYGLVERLAASELTVLVHGETGSGKELVAAALHYLSPRAAAPRVAINCAALPENLVESELFGYERGAFSGAASARAGIFEQARGGTVFLDEVGELSPLTQAKLLRVLETRRVVRLGDAREIAIDVRVVAATNRDLKEEIKAGRFRQDLYFRLAGASIWVPPLRDRPREVPILAVRFLAEAAARAGHAPPRLSEAAIQRLAVHAWPGNVRELKNVCEYLAATVGSELVDEVHLDGLLGDDEVRLPAPSPAKPEPPVAGFRPIAEELEELERRRLREALDATGGNQTRAARAIAMPLRTFLNRLKRYGIRP